VPVVAGKIPLHDMSADFGIGLRAELVAFLDELSFQAEIVFDDTVMDNHNLAGTVAVRVRVLLAPTPVCGPASVADAISAVERLQANHGFQIAQLALGAAHLQAFAIACYRDPGGVIFAIFQPPQTVKNDRHNALVSNIPNNPAHKIDPDPRAPPLSGSSELVKSPTLTDCTKESFTYMRPRELPRW